MLRLRAIDEAQRTSWTVFGSRLADWMEATTKTTYDLTAGECIIITIIGLCPWKSRPTLNFGIALTRQSKAVSNFGEVVSPWLLLRPWILEEIR